MRRAVDLTQIALHAIWGNKLRSTLTILGNIVSVGSIIAVVSLIQGVNDEVAGAIVSQFGSDSFRVSRTGLLMSEEDEEAARGNPRISLDDAEASSVAVTIGITSASDRNMKTARLRVMRSSVPFEVASGVGDVPGV